LLNRRHFLPKKKRKKKRKKKWFAAIADARQNGIDSCTQAGIQILFCLWITQGNIAFTLYLARTGKRLPAMAMLSARDMFILTGLLIKKHQKQDILPTDQAALSKRFSLKIGPVSSAAK
jgi:hypothetical protein